MQENILLLFGYSKKNSKKIKRNNLFQILEDCKKQNLEGKEWVVK